MDKNSHIERSLVDGKADYGGRIKLRSGKWVVLDRSKKKEMGEHPTYAKAVKAVRDDMFSGGFGKK